MKMTLRRKEIGNSEVRWWRWRWRKRRRKKRKQRRKAWEIIRGWKGVKFRFRWWLVAARLEREGRGCTRLSIMHSHGPCLAHSPVNAVDRRRSRRDDSCSHVNPSRLSLSFLVFSFSFSSFFLVRRNERLMMKAWLGRDAKGMGFEED